MELNPKSFGEKFCKIVWMGNVAAGISFAMAGGFLCCVTFGYSFRVNLLGLTLDAFLAGSLAVLLGASTAVCSIWRVR